MERFLSKKLPGGKFVGVSVMRSRTMSAIRGKHAKTTEMALRVALKAAGIGGWRFHPVGLVGNPDVIFPKERVVIFVDGCFWHGCPRCGHIPKTRTPFWRAKIGRNRERDRRTVRALRKSGLTVLRVWEHSLAKPDRVGRVMGRITALLELRAV